MAFGELIVETIFLVVMIVAIGSIVAAIVGHRRALRGELDSSRSAIRRSAVFTGIACVLSLWLNLGWPWKESTVTVFEEVVQPIQEIAEEAYEETTVTTTKPPWWKFWSKPSESSETVIRNRPVTRIVEKREHVPRSAQASEFSGWLLIPMLAIGWLGYKSVTPLVRLHWRVWG